MVINDVLDLSKLDESKLELEQEPFNIRQTLEDSLEVVFFDSEKKRLEMLLDVDTRVPEVVTGDVRRVRQILVNLLSNAVKFSAKGEIVLSARCLDVEDNPQMIDIVFSVADQGIGIAEENKKKLFGEFTQADVSMSRKYGGTGTAENRDKHKKIF
jgi:signal transduction histidine kinase